MRYLHPVAAHERFVAGGHYDFHKQGAPLQKSETWTIHAHPTVSISSASMPIRYEKRAGRSWRRRCSTKLARWRGWISVMKM